MGVIYASAMDLSEAMARGALSAREVMQATLDRVDAVNGPLNAIVSLADHDDLLAQAQAADNAPRAGWLHGIPIAIKDLARAKGFNTTSGSTLFTDQMAHADDVHVKRLRDAGAIVIGKTNVPEFGLGSHTFNPVHGATYNPYAPDVTAGGSSGGAAVALATGMLSVADGSDMMGSLRNPAGWNNVYSLRPSWGLVPSEPLGETFLHQISTNGPMARHPRDLAALLDTMAGPDPRQPHGRPKPNALDQLVNTTQGVRIGWLKDWDGAWPFEEGILDLCESALKTVEGVGVRVEDVAAPFDRDMLWQSWQHLRHFAIAGALSVLYDNPSYRSHLKATAIWEIEGGRALTAMDVHRASLIRSQWFMRVHELFETYDVLALPTAQVWPFTMDLEYPTDIAGQQMDTYHRWMEVMIPVSLIGLPAVTVPAGFGGPRDLPMGLQLFGKRGSDAQLLSLAQAWHEATGGPDRRKPLV